MTITVKCYCDTHFLRSPEAVFKIIELLIGLASWSLVFIGNVVATSSDLPQVNNEALLVSLATLPCWIITCSSFIFFLVAERTKCSLKIDAMINFIFAVLFVVVTMFCSSSTNFIWVCMSAEDDVLATKFCESPNHTVLRNKGENLALMMLTSILSTVYLMHFIFVITKLCTKTFLPYQHKDVNFFLINN